MEKEELNYAFCDTNTLVTENKRHNVKTIKYDYSNNDYALFAVDDKIPVFIDTRGYVLFNYNEIIDFIDGIESENVDNTILSNKYLIYEEFSNLLKYMSDFNLIGDMNKEYRRLLKVLEIVMIK